jgi:hypothetical protein
LIIYLLRGDLGLPFIDFGLTSGIRVESFSAIMVEKAMGRGTEQLE